ncbi:MAG: hypothetical protein JRG71_08015 [Deltaproteobacteria bacterium]|nr:hypothetical protein [Deltaproteobacteria bacterium]
MKIDLDPLSRYCPTCHKAMQAGKQVGEAPTIIPFFREGSFQTYHCQECDKDIQVATSGLVTAQFGSVMMALFISGLIIWNIKSLPLWFDFSEAPLIGLLSAMTALIAILLILGGIYNALALIRNLTLLGQAPLCHRTPLHMLIRIVASILYSFIPWVYWFGAGFLNDTVFHIDRDWAVVVVVPGLLPFFVADRVGLSPTTIFLLSASYPTAGMIYMWMS